MGSRTREGSPALGKLIALGFGGFAFTLYILAIAAANKDLESSGRGCSIPFCFNDATTYWFFMPVCEEHKYGLFPTKK